LLIDLGTATTLCAGGGGATTGGVILTTCREALDSGTSKLGAVEIIRAGQTLGRTTAASIQSGLYYGHLGALQEIIRRVVTEEFAGQRPTVIATGGFGSLFEDTGLFDVLIPDLVLQGLKLAAAMNAN
jgi:type III pantothenate kinase